MNSIALNDQNDGALDWNELAEYRKVDLWNEQYPPGVDVIVHLDSGEKLNTITRSQAEVLCGQAVIWLQGVTGCYSLDAVKIAD